MSIVSDYKRQSAWRAWPTIFNALPDLRGQAVLDLGCGLGDQAAELVARGARVTGVDINEELLREARAKSLKSADFQQGDLSKLPKFAYGFDGLWCSFTAAYFVDLPAALFSWARNLRPGGWIAITEIDNLFRHEPLGARTKALFEAYARDALIAGRYDFHMGRKLETYLKQTGFAISQVMIVGDLELSFTGAANPQVLEAWRNRLDRMKLLRDFCGMEFGSLREDFLSCLTRPDHYSLAKVYCCIATKSDHDSRADRPPP